jgi:hypothetical protein
LNSLLVMNYSCWTFLEVAESVAIARHKNTLRPCVIGR